MCPGKHLQSKVHHTRDPIGPFKTEKENQVGSTHPVDHQTESELMKYRWWVAKKDKCCMMALWSSGTFERPVDFRGKRGKHGTLAWHQLQPRVDLSLFGR